MKLQELLYRVYFNTYTNHITLISSRSFNISYSLDIEVSKNLEVPIYVPCIRSAPILKDMVYNNSRGLLPDKYSIPLQILNKVEKKTFSSIMTNSLDNYLPNIFECHAGDDIFYAGTGIILNKDFKLLMLMALETFVYPDEAVLDVIVKRPVCFIDSSVLVNKNDYISKNIAKKILPELSNMNVYRVGSEAASYQPVNYTPKIIIDDLDSIFMSKVSTPTNIETIQEDLNKCLVDNIDDAMTEML